ncbi:sugar transporter, putative [Talaromyces stipitatus ATCC 10500]|uniref:Sugar transporter, putative n=1 Tax=Talaromyces stipitatus (strain ATCC 10500 / CBS 375.48 / QM 6759 / NRRL 1006) TaxID=441959 RepID=B8MNB1_TALSN|nr:sugar transporter, putative [Talaromyces stipitatus ATCC 10500]EED14000.1 sugar transporter, putative [Talaromyces stipitatus ATCC 10500]
MADSKDAVSTNVDGAGINDFRSSHLADIDSSIDLNNELIDTSKVDDVLTRKMALVNAAIDEIGMTPFQWKLFFLNGFGYAVDSLLVVCQSIAQPAATQEFRNPSKHIAGISLASQVGLLVGAAVWGFSADVIGRKLAFNTSLFICAAFVLIAGGMPSYISFSAMVAIYSAGAGGNYILDATNFLEFLPVSHAWLVTFLSVWWAVGYTVTGLLAWAFMSNFSCAADAVECRRSDNMGWRYLHFTCGTLVLVLSVFRLFAIRMVQTPKWLTSQNRDEELYAILVNLSETYKRPLSLTLEKLQAQGRVLHTEKSVWSGLRLKSHFSGLFSTTKLAYSTVMIIVNWLLIGTVSPLYGVFLPYYLASRGADTGDNSNYTTWRNYAINQVAGLIGPIIAGFLVGWRWFGRRGTLAVGAAITTALQLGYTQIKTPAQNVGVSAAISAASNIYYGTIYAYTPEILPSAHRATGYGLCVVLNRIGGIVGVLVGSYANVETVIPLWICAGLYGALIFTSLLLPFESRGKRTV